MSGDHSPIGASRKLQPYFSDAPSQDAFVPLEASSNRRPKPGASSSTPLRKSKKGSHPPRVDSAAAAPVNAPAWFDDHQATAWVHPDDAALAALDGPLEPATPSQSRRKGVNASVTESTLKKRTRAGKKVKKQQVTVASAGSGLNYNDRRWQEDEEFKDVLDDLSSRFILNLPAEELELPERVCFQVEQAHWFYEDFIREDIPRLPSFTLRRFSEIFFRHCPLLSQWSGEHEQAFERFMQYKIRVPVCGAIMLNERWDRCVLVKGWKASASWGFPKGKINREELKPDCAVREVFEETGFDCSDLLDPEDFIEFEMNDQRMTLYIVTDVPEDTVFQTQTRKEISAIEWFKLTDLPTWKNKKHGPGSNGSKKYRFYMLAPFVAPLKQWIKLNKDLVMDSGREEDTPTLEAAQPAKVEPPASSAPATPTPAASEIDELFKRFLGSDARPSTPKAAKASTARAPATPDPSMQMLLQKLSTASPKPSHAPTASKSADLLSMRGRGAGASPKATPATAASTPDTKQEKQRALLDGLMASIGTPSGPQGHTPVPPPNGTSSLPLAHPPQFSHFPANERHQVPVFPMPPPQQHQMNGSMGMSPTIPAGPLGAMTAQSNHISGGIHYPPSHGVPVPFPPSGFPPPYSTLQPGPPVPPMMVPPTQPPAHPLLASLSPVAPRAMAQGAPMGRPPAIMSQAPHKAPLQATNASQLLSMLGGGSAAAN